MKSGSSTAARAGAATLQVNAIRCVHQRSVHASCTHCTDACTRGALQDNATGVTLDADRCDACGLCVAACPTGTLALEKTNPCSVPDSGLHERNLPCIHALDEARLLQWHSEGLRRLGLGAENCQTCPSAPPTVHLRLGTRLRRVNDALQSRRQPPLILCSTADPSPSLPKPEPVGTRMPATQYLSQLGVGQPLWGVQLEAQRCNACGTCVRLCPTQAISHIEQSGQQHLQLDMSCCVGCNLCVQSCDQNALASSNTSSVAVRPLRWPLAVSECGNCGAGFATLQVQRRGTQVLRCPSCKSNGPRRPNRWVQPDPAGFGA